MHYTQTLSGIIKSILWLGAGVSKFWYIGISDKNIVNAQRIAVQ